MTTRRKLLVALGTGALAAAFSSLTQQQAKVWRIGYLSPRAGIDSFAEAFLQGLRDLGYVEGQNIVIEWRFASGKADRLPELAAELVRLNVDCILAGGANSALAAKQATSTIPIVMGNTDDDPVRLGLVVGRSTVLCRRDARKARRVGERPLLAKCTVERVPFHLGGG
jgi:putative ABC transport system substrate-binding protein